MWVTAFCVAYSVRVPLILSMCKGFISYIYLCGLSLSCWIIQNSAHLLFTAVVYLYYSIILYIYCVREPITLSRSKALQLPQSCCIESIQYTNRCSYSCYIPYTYMKNTRTHTEQKQRNLPLFVLYCCFHIFFPTNSFLGIKRRVRLCDIYETCGLRYVVRTVH